MKYCICILALLLVVVSGCKTADSVRTHNREQLVRLSPGMMKNEVLNVMGTKTMTATTETIPYTRFKINNPYRTEFYQSGGANWELLLYYTDVKRSDNAITDDELTPLVLKDGTLEGWGWSFWEGQVQKYEIRVR